MMKYILKFLVWFICVTVLGSLLMWFTFNCVPLFTQFIKAVEISTDYHFTYTDYLLSAILLEIIGIITSQLKWLSKLF